MLCLELYVFSELINKAQKLIKKSSLKSSDRDIIVAFAGAFKRQHIRLTVTNVPTT